MALARRARVPGHGAVDERPGHPLDSRCSAARPTRSAGKFHVLGRARARGGGRRTRADRHGTTQSAAKAGIDVRFEAKATRLVTDERGRVTGVVVRTADGDGDHRGQGGGAGRGGFEANVEMRTRYLGPNWDLARVRGTPYNTGDGIRMALDIGAQPWGHWSGCHAVQWDLNAPWHGDRKVGDNFQKHSYPLGLIVNLQGRALRRRGRGLPQLHVREVRPRRSSSSRGAPRSRSSTRRSCICCARSTGSARSPRRRTGRLEELAKKLEIDVEGLVKTVRGLQRRGHAARHVQSGRSRTARARRASRRRSPTGRCRSTRRRISGSR